jgi:hypothetical protein
MTREKLEGLFARRWPEPSKTSFAQWNSWWIHHSGPFNALLDIGTDEAFLAAAMMCVPEGHFWSITMRGEKRGGYHACCVLEGPLEWHDGPTPAEALIEAITRAKESDNG